MHNTFNQYLDSLHVNTVTPNPHLKRAYLSPAELLILDCVQYLFENEYNGQRPDDDVRLHLFENEGSQVSNHYRLLNELDRAVQGQPTATDTVVDVTQYHNVLHQAIRNRKTIQCNVAPEMTASPYRKLLEQPAQEVAKIQDKLITQSLRNLEQLESNAYGEWRFRRAIAAENKRFSRDLQAWTEKEVILHTMVENKTYEGLIHEHYVHENTLACKTYACALSALYEYRYETDEYDIETVEQFLSYVGKQPNYAYMLDTLKINNAAKLQRAMLDAPINPVQFINT